MHFRQRHFFSRLYIGEGVFIEPHRITVGQWLDTWLNEYKKHCLKPATYASYEINIRVHLKPRIGGILLQKLTTHQVKLMENNIYGDGKKSTSLIIKVHNILHCSLGQAVKNQLVARNVSDNVVLPRHKTKPIRILTLDEQNEFFSVLREEESRNIFRAYLLTGMRLGELLALTWNDIDLEKKTININKNLIMVQDYVDRVRAKTKLILQDSTKTINGMRKIPMPDTLVRVLSEHRELQEKIKRNAAGVYADNNFVLCNALGDYYKPRNVQEKFERISRLAGIEGATVHSLRHTYATRLFELGVPAKIVSELLGHSNVMQTLNTYTHVMPELKHEAVEKLDLIANL